MSQLKTYLEETLEAWEDARMGIIQEVKNVPEDKFEFRPTSEVRSVKELVVHILEVAMMMTGELTRQDTNFQRAPWPELLKMYASEAYHAETKSEFINLLNSQLQYGEQKFREVGELHMLQLIKRFDGQLGTRLAWLQHAIAQEMYHRGQLTLYQRLLGIEPALTSKIKMGT
ncbi:MAG: DinB family protein [bacterium]